MERKCIINFAAIRPLTMFVLRIALAGIFIVAAYGKLLHTGALVATVENYNILPLPLARYFAYTLPWIEIIAGIMLLIGLGTRGSALALGLLLVSFIIAIAVNLHRGVSMACGCFDLFGMNEKIGSSILFRDILFLLVAAALAYTKDFILSLDTYLERKTRT